MHLVVVDCPWCAIAALFEWRVGESGSAGGEEGNVEVGDLRGSEELFLEFGGVTRSPEKIKGLYDGEQGEPAGETCDKKVNE